MICEYFITVYLLPALKHFNNNDFFCQIFYFVMQDIPVAFVPLAICNPWTENITSWLYM